MADKSVINFDIVETVDAGDYLQVVTDPGGTPEWVNITFSDLVAAISGVGTFQPLDATLTAFAALTIAANTITIGTSADAFSQTSFAANTFPARASSGSLVAKSITDFGLSLVDDTTDTAARATLGLVIGTHVAAIASPTFTGIPAAPTAAGGTSTTQLATTAFVSAAISTAVSGLIELKGSLDCSANPNYPSASTGDAYYVSAAGKIGGASGESVDIGDTIIASADNAGGTEASVGTSWFVLEHNLAGAMLSANNLSDVASALAARSNLGLVIGTDVAAQSSLSSYLPLAGGTLTATSAASNILTLQQVGDPYTGAALKFLSTEGYYCNVRFEQRGGFHPLIFDFGINDGYSCGIQMQRGGVDKLWFYPTPVGGRARSTGDSFVFDHDNGSYVGEWLKYDGVTNIGGPNTGGLKIWEHATLRQFFLGTDIFNYSNYTDVSNYKGMKLSAASGSVTLAAVVAGTYAADNVDLILTPAGTGSVIVSGSGGVRSAYFGNRSLADPSYVFNFEGSTSMFGVMEVNSTTASDFASIRFNRRRSGSYVLNAADSVAKLAFNAEISSLEAVATSNVTGSYSTVDLRWYAYNAAGVGAERMRLTAEGQLGIATATPIFRLDIGGASSTDSYLNTFRAGFALIGGHSGAEYDSIGYNTKPTSSNGVYNYAMADTACRIQFHLGGFRFFTAASGTIGNPITETERFTITQGGYVGIGASTPAYPLHVTGVIYATVGLAFGGNYDAIIASSNSGFFDFNSLQGIKINPGGAFSTHFTAGGLVGIATASPTNLLSLGGNAARTFWMERHTTVDTAGNTLTVQAGGATSGATDKAGGDLYLLPGTSTGTGESGVRIQGCVAGATGTADRSMATVLRVLGDKFFLDQLTASRVLTLDADKKVVASTVTATELGYLSGLTGSLSLGAVKAIFTGTANASVTNTVTETTLVPSGVGSATLAANYFVAGKAVRITAKGILSTATIPGTLQLRIRFGGVSGTLVLDTGANTPTSMLADTLWEITAIVTCRTTGVSGTVNGQSDFYHEVTAVGAPYSWAMVNTSPVTFDTTASAAIAVSAQWGTADAGNSITCTDITIEQITNPA